MSLSNLLTLYMFCLDSFAMPHLTHAALHMLGKWNFPDLYGSRQREGFPYWALTGKTGISWQPGWKYQQQDVVFVRGHFPVLGSYKHTAIHQTCCYSHRFTFPPLADSHSLSLPPLCSLIVFLPLSVTSQLSPVTLANQTESSSLMRLFGVAFPSEKDKGEWEKEQEEARRRDHRRIGTVR